MEKIVIDWSTGCCVSTQITEPVGCRLPCRNCKLSLYYNKNKLLLFIKLKALTLINLVVMSQNHSIVMCTRERWS